MCLYRLAGFSLLFVTTIHDWPLLYTLSLSSSVNEAIFTMAPRRSNRKASKKAVPPKKGSSKKEKTPTKEDEPKVEPSSPTSVGSNDENEPPPSKEVATNNTRARRTRAKQAISYQEDSDTDPCSDDEVSDVEGALKTSPKGKKRAAAAKKKLAAAKSAKKPKVHRPDLSVRPPDGNSPRPIVGREIEMSPCDWRDGTCRDY